MTWRNSKILAPKTIFTESFIGVFFDDQTKAENFQTFIKTDFVRFCNTESATDHNAYSKVWRFVPNFKDTLNPRTNLVGWNSDWNDEDLKIIFKDILTEDDWIYISETAKNSDSKTAEK